MNANIIPPASNDAAKLPDPHRTPVFSTATFHEIKLPATPGALIEIGDRRTPAARSWDRAQLSAPYSVWPPSAGKSGEDSWRRHIGSARLTWGKLSNGELERIKGDAAKLSTLLLRHYSFDRHEADRQVKSFFQRNRV